DADRYASHGHNGTWPFIIFLLSLSLCTAVPRFLKREVESHPRPVFSCPPAAVHAGPQAHTYILLLRVASSSGDEGSVLQVSGGRVRCFWNSGRDEHDLVVCTRTMRGCAKSGRWARCDILPERRGCCIAR
ncbi:hypothetical protein C8F04DRAFT_1101667, partial [Mycena alexandri]